MDSIHIPAYLNLEFLSEVWRGTALTPARGSISSEGKKEASYVWWSEGSVKSVKDWEPVQSAERYGIRHIWHYFFVRTAQNKNT